MAKVLVAGGMGFVAGLPETSTWIYDRLASR